MECGDVSPLWIPQGNAMMCELSGPYLRSRAKWGCDFHVVSNYALKPVTDQRARKEGSLWLIERQQRYHRIQFCNGTSQGKKCVETEHNPPS